MDKKKLETNFVGLKFPNPFMLASAPPTTNGEMIQRAFDMGWGGAIIKTLCCDLEVTQNVRPRIHSTRIGKNIFAFANMELGSPRPIDKWLEDIQVIKRNYPENILFASLLHTEKLEQEQWEATVKRCADAGIDGFELNFSCSHGMAEKGGGGRIAENVDLIKEIIGWVRKATELPVMVKFPVLVENLPSKVEAAKSAGADAVSAINSINCIPEVDIYNFVPRPTVDGVGAFCGLSGHAIRPVGLRTVAQIAKNVDIPISGIGGIYTWEDAVQYFLVGATTVQMCTSVMQNGYEIIKKLSKGLRNYMDEMDFANVNQIVGKALPKIVPHRELSRSYRVVGAVDSSLCNKCKSCLIACRDSGYQAISLNEKGYPEVSIYKCDGCGICVQVCPNHAMSYQQLSIEGG